MDMTSTRERPDNTLFESKVNANNLLNAFHYYSNSIKTLSLDCFDTIIWRNTATPTDVFFDLQHNTSFKKLGLNPILRIRAESDARLLKVIKHWKTEVTLRDIYLQYFPSLSEDEIKELTDAEINAEINALYAFPPMLDLIRAAHTKGIPVIIVSDTYFTEAQLRRILQHVLPEDVYQMISTIFCSSEHGQSKVNGIFNTVLAKLQCNPQDILHVGDNPAADYSAPKSLQLHALHFVHHEENVAENLRMQSSMACIMDPSIRHTRSLTSPFRAMLATANLNQQNAEEMIGYGSIGPIVYSFAKFILHEIDGLRKQGNKVKVAFLMRDAYLPSLICDTISSEKVGERIFISRFAAYASSFRTAADVERYLAEVLFTGRFADIARQLLLPQPICDSILKNISNSSEAYAKFAKEVMRRENLNIIFNKSKSYFNRLKNHLHKELKIESGDTLAFIDLGYSGTAQRLLEPIFKNELNIKVVGRYLLALSVPGWNESRRGLFDPEWYDERTLLSLVAYIALLEQICTSTDRSVVDYNDDGSPIFSDSTVGKLQHSKLEFIQQQTIRFADDANKFFNSLNNQFPITQLRDAALSELSRLIYLPSSIELQHLQSFQFDLNLGTNDLFSVFDQTKGFESLRKRGMFFSSMEKSGKSMRTNYPAELRAAGLEHALAFIAHHRYSLEFKLKDTNLRSESIRIIAIQGNENSQFDLDAHHTYDGYFSLCVPVHTTNIHIGLLFGQQYQWLQIYSIELINMRAYLTKVEIDYSEDCNANTVTQDMLHHGNNLYECQSNTALMMISPPEKNDGQQYILRVTYRPIVKR